MRRLRAMSAGAMKVANRVVYVGADMIKAEAQRLITTGSVSGAGHKPSAPGTPPNNDTGVLKSNIETTNPRPLVAEVRSEAPYAAIHEFGGTIHHPGGTPFFMRDGKPVFVSNRGFGAYHNLPTTKPHDITLEERPYMRPARDAKEPEIQRLFAHEIDKLNRSSGR